MHCVISLVKLSPLSLGLVPPCHNILVNLRSYPYSFYYNQPIKFFDVDRKEIIFYLTSIILVLIEENHGSANAQINNGKM